MFDLPLLQDVCLLLKQHKLKISCAESCTGGLLATALTHLAGSSNWFDMSWVSYSNLAKQQLLNVQESTIVEHGVVSAEVVREMALGVLKHSQADIAVSISGIAGPTGGSAQKPVGTVCFGFAYQNHVFSKQVHFSGNRALIRTQAVNFALEEIKQLIINYEIV